MSYLKTINIITEKSQPFPFNIPGIRYAKNIDVFSSLNFFIGDNGTGKSTLLEAIAFRLQLPHMDGSNYMKNSFNAAKTLAPYLDLKFEIDRPVGFFFRAEDFGDYLNSVNRNDLKLHSQLDSLVGEVPEKIIQEMKDNANYQIHHMRKNYGQVLSTFSHGEAYLQIMQEKIKGRGIYLLDEPEAALSPSKQLALITFIFDHLKNYNSQFIIATHSPILMAMPGSKLYEITESSMENKSLDDLEHYVITKGFLNNPELFLRHLK